MKKFYYLISLVALILFAHPIHSQTIQLTFTGKDTLSQNHVPLDSIFIRNINNGSDTLLRGNDTTLLLDVISGLHEMNKANRDFELIQNFPNPFTTQTTFILRVFVKDNFQISMTNIYGQKLFSKYGCYDAGTHLFTLSGNQCDFYILSVNNSSTLRSIKIINSQPYGNSPIQINYVGYQPINYFYEAAKQTAGLLYSMGDQLQYIGYSSGYELGALYDSPQSNTNYTFSFKVSENFTCGQDFTDSRDGKTYHTVMIGTQCWMAQNLNIGNKIPGSTDQANNNIIEKYCYNNNESNCTIYGGLYQWNEIMQYDTNRYTQGICPTGWHLPTIDEWNTLITHYGGLSLAGDSLKPTGISGFNALMSGERNLNGTFSGLNNQTILWTSNQHEESNASYYSLSQNNSTVTFGDIARTSGYSVRCVKGLYPIVKPDVVIIDTTVYTLISDSTELSQGIYKYTYNKKRKTNDIINQDVIIGKSGEGYLRRVQSISDQPPILTLYTTQAYIEDVIQQGEFNVSVNYDSIGKKRNNLDGQNNNSSRTFYHHFSNFTLFAQTTLNVVLNDATISFTPDDHFYIKIEHGVIQLVDYEMKGNVETSLNVTTTMGDNLNLSISNLLLPWLINFPIYVPGVPFPFSCNIDLVGKGKFTSDHSLTCTTGLFANDQFDYYIKYEYGTWSFSKTDNKDQGLSNIIVSDISNNLIKVSLGPEVSIKLFNSMGPYFFAGGYGKLTTSNSGQPLFNKDAELKAGLGVDIGFNVGLETPFFSWTIANKSLVDVGWDWSIWRVPETLMMISGNNQSGNPNQQLPNPLIVKVVDNIGNAFPNIPVHFSISQGGGTLSGYDVLTDNNGLAQVYWTLGPSAGTNNVTVRVQKADGTDIIGSPLLFIATAGGGVVIPTVTTSSVTNITQTTATSGGNVTSDGGATVTARGVCWSTSQNPTTSDTHTSDGTGNGTFVSNLNSLSATTLYYVRAYATNSVGTAYGSQVNFTTTGSSGGQPCPGTPTVLYEGKTYNTVQVGTQCWLKENLNVGTRINGSQNQDPTNGIKEKYCYDDLESNCDIYGGLYQWDEMMQGSTTEGAQGICPSGWHLPTDAEWTILTTYLGGEGIAGGKLKSTGTIEDGTGLWYSPNTGATNESGFTALPGGTGGGWFAEISSFGYFWSSTLYSGTHAWQRFLSASDANVIRNWDDETDGSDSSVRCVKD